MKKILKTEKEMHELAAEMAKKAKPGDVFFLEGDLGAGKTTFARGFLHALGYKGKVKSPTYTIVETYPIGDIIVNHFDLYRLKTPEALEEIGFSDYLGGQHICLIEWPALADSFVPHAKVITFEIKDNERLVRSVLR